MYQGILKIVNIATRGGKVPPLYLFISYILPGAIYFRYLTGTFKLLPFLLISISIIPLMAATNLFDDYFDYKYGYDKEYSPNTRYRKHPIYYFGVSKNYLLIWGSISVAIYFILFSIISYIYGIYELIIAIIGFILGYGYTGPPFGFKYKAMGEASVVLSALLISIMVFYGESADFSMKEIIFAVPYSIILVPVLFLGNYRDMDYDKSQGMKTLPVILGAERSRYIPATIFIIFYLLIIIYYVENIYPIMSVLSLMTIPVSFYGVRKWMDLPDSRYENFMGNLIFLDTIVLSLLILL
ncbi:MAG: prenyltransferase [Thermoplasmata archaeon]